jgi:glycosyltransferase involved in cell wall biosynthesis
MKKIIFIGGTPPPYHGVTISNKRILDSKISDIFNIFHLDTSDHRNVDNLGKLDLTNILLAVKNFVTLIFKILKLKPDLLYLPISQNIAYLRDGMFILLSKCFGRPKVVIHLRGSYFRKYYDKSNWIIRKFIDLTVKKADTAIVLGHSLKYIFDGWVKNCKVIPNGTDFSPDISKKKFGNSNNIIIGYLSNLRERKGVLDIIEAINILINKYNHKNVKIKFAGPWRDEKFKCKVLEYIKNNKLDKYVEFVGFIVGKDKENFLLKSDIFLFPSWDEGHPNVILEAMAAACPVISSKSVGAIPETVIDGKTGLLVEKQNPKAITEAIIYLIENPEKRKEMGLAGRKRFEKNYTLDKNINNLIKVFEEVSKS